MHEAGAGAYARCGAEQRSVSGDDDSSELRLLLRALPRERVTLLLFVVLVNGGLCWSYDVRSLWPRQPRVIEIPMSVPCAVNEVKLYADALRES